MGSRTADKGYRFTFDVTCEASNFTHFTYTGILTDLFTLRIFGEKLNLLKPSGSCTYHRV